MRKISFAGSWKLYYFPQGQHLIQHPGELANLSLPWVEARVPGNVELDLSRGGILPEDLFFADNIKSLKPYESYEWWYEYEFETPRDTEGKRVELCFHGVDCLAAYWLNGMELGTSDNMLIEHRFDVENKLNRQGTNTLHVRIQSPLIKAAGRKYKPYHGLSWGETNMEHLWIRKAPHSYGWDIMPRALSAGLWRSVELTVHEEQEISELYFFTYSLQGNKATVGVFYSLDVDMERISELEIMVSGKCGKSVFEGVHKVPDIAGTIWVTVDNPALWWPAGYGEPKLYELTLQLVCSGKVIAERIEWVGIRTVELLRTDITSLENPGQFLFQVNHKPILCKGSNWVPADAFHSRDAERYEEILKLFQDTNCNMVRCWGGNVYEDHSFFEFCDNNGLMVWQDFAMACALYPQTQEFLESMTKEAESVVRKLRNHPSLILWCGDNECDQNAMSRGIDPNKNRITRQVLPEVILQCDPYRPYLPSSPYYSPGAVSKKEDQLLPERHLWGPRDYYKSRFYTENTAHFVSEIGYHGCPGLSSLKSFIDEEHLWPWQDNEQWITHATSAAGKKGAYAYRIKLMADQIGEMFGVYPDNLEDFILASQISQAEAKKFFIEMTRLKKWRRTGIIWWNMMDGWPQFSDAVVDYYFNKKLAYYYIRRAQQPVCIMLDEIQSWHIRAVVGNDSLRDAAGDYRIWDADTGEMLLEGKFRVKANENTVLGQIRVSHSDKKLLLIQWNMENESFGNHYLLGFPAFSLETYKKWLVKIAALPKGFRAEEIGT